MSYIDLDQPLDARQAALRQRFGPSFVCSCFRCRFELRRRSFRSSGCCLAGGGLGSGFLEEELLELAALGMQSARYAEAYELYGLVIDRNPSHGDALHGRGAAMLEAGYWLQAHVHFRKAAAQAPQHERLAAQAKKEQAYHLGPDGFGLRGPQLGSSESSSPFALPEFKGYLGGRAFMTIGTSPVVSDAECKYVIETAERHAAEQSGWTTSRHYAVPTTDLPVHEIPKALEWFKELLQSRLGPLLAEQWGSSIVGQEGQWMRMFDVFIVKYCASQQRHLPVHKDQSTHSFTISLNDPSEYEGGGTYICDLGEALSPSKGHVLSFEGELLHGGEPITKGTRYIIAAFCYVEKPGAESSAPQPFPELEGGRARKRARTADSGPAGGEPPGENESGESGGGIDWSAAAAGGSSFSFGF